ncbi:MAG: sigma 54-interacting transcriptional regulator, partial [Myxococcota bacterium]
RELPFLRRDLAEAYPTHEPDLLEPWLERAVQDLAVLDAPVVVIGPPGSGKEFVARRIHALSDQGRGPFITFAASNCPPSLWALELFGDADAYGHMTAAVDGTLFVEDAGVLEDRLLDRLLRELPRQAGPVRLILSVRLSPTEAPEGFIQSAGGLLGELVRGLLANQRVVVPPLSERGAVLGRIVDHYMMQWAMKHNRVITSMAPATFDLLRRHPWPAGVTELKAILEAAVLRCDSQTLLPEHTGLTSTGTGSDGILVDLDELAQATGNLEALLMDVQAAVYLEAYNREQGNKTAAARLVGVKRSTYVRRLKALLGEE